MQQLGLRRMIEAKLKDVALYDETEDSAVGIGI